MHNKKNDSLTPLRKTHAAIGQSQRKGSLGLRVGFMANIFVFLDQVGFRLC